MSNQLVPLRWERAFIVALLVVIAGAFQKVIGGLWDPFNMLFYLIGMRLVFRDFNNSILLLIKNPLILVLTGLAVLSVFWSDAPVRTFTRSVGLVCTTLAATYLVSQYSIKEILRFLAWAMGIIAVFSIIFVFALPSYGQAGDGAWLGVFGQKNVLGRTMALGAIVFLTLPTESRRTTIIRIFGYLLCALILARTSSTTALILLAAITAFFFIYRLLWLGGVATFAVMLIVITPLIAAVMLLASVQIEEVLLSLGKDTTLTGRVGLWENVSSAIGERPILGYGYGGFWQQWDGMFGTLWTRRSQWIANSSHNTYLDITLQLGVVGLILFVLGALWVYLQSFFEARRVKSLEGLFPILFMSFVFVLSFSEDFALYLSIFWTVYLLIAFHFVKATATVPPEQAPVPTLATQEFYVPPALVGGEGD